MINPLTDRVKTLNKEIDAKRATGAPTAALEEERDRANLQQRFWGQKFDQAKAAPPAAGAAGVRYQEKPENAPVFGGGLNDFDMQFNGQPKDVDCTDPMAYGDHLMGKAKAGADVFVNNYFSNKVYRFLNSHPTDMLRYFQRALSSVNFDIFRGPETALLQGTSAAEEAAAAELAQSLSSSQMEAWQNTQDLVQQLMANLKSVLR